MPAVLSFTYARGIYDRGCKTLRTVLLKSVPSLYPMPNHSGGKSRCRSRRKGRGKGYHSLLVSLVVVLSIVDIGEARWFGDTNDGGVIEGVTEVFDDANVEKVNMDQVCYLCFPFRPPHYHFYQLINLSIFILIYSLSQEVAGLDKT